MNTRRQTLLSAYSGTIDSSSEAANASAKSNAFLDQQVPDIRSPLRFPVLGNPAPVPSMHLDPPPAARSSRVPQAVPVAAKAVGAPPAIPAPAPNRQINAVQERHGLGNIGNSCFANSALHYLFASPFIVRALSQPLQPRNMFATDPRTKVRTLDERTTQTDFVRRTRIQSYLKELHTLLYTKPQAKDSPALCRWYMGQLLRLVNDGAFSDREQHDAQEFFLAVCGVFDFLAAEQMGLSWHTILPAQKYRTPNGQEYDFEIPAPSLEDNSMLCVEMPRAQPSASAQSAASVPVFDLQEAIKKAWRPENNVNFDATAKGAGPNGQDLKVCDVLTQRHVQIRHVPDTLLVQLKRFINHGAYLEYNNAPVHINPCLKLHVSSPAAGGAGYDVDCEVYSAVIHRGSLKGGHYVAMEKIADDRWAIYDDAHVSVVTQVAAQRILDEGGYLLGYRRLPPPADNLLLG